MNGPGPSITADNVGHREAKRRSEDRKSVVVMDPRLDPSRWWFASSAFPMIAGTLGPVASAFSICALVRPWRQHAPKGSTIQTGDFVKDPAWLIAVNAVQLVVALISNMFLLLNMARRVRFSIAQPVTIVGWYMSSICLTVLLCTAAGPLIIEPDDEYIWSQAFFYGLWAAILYFVVASLMAITALGAHRGHYSRDFQLTNSQRTLMLQTIMYLMYMLVGALVFSRLEDWTYLDAVYWANVTLFTIGFGDLIVTSSVGRGLLIPYAFVGIVSVGLVIGSIRSLVLQRAGRRIDARMVEKKRLGVIKDMARRGDGSVLRPIRADADADADADAGASRRPQDARRAEFERRETEFNLMRAIQHEGLVRRRWVATAISMGPWLLLWLGGAVAFVEFERPYQDWSYFDGVYFTFVSLTTLGYGDVTPQSNGGRSFFVFWALLALPTMTVLISNASDTVVKLIRDATLGLGNITILPGEKGFKRDMRYAVHKVSLGVLFRDRFAAEKHSGDTDDTLRALNTHVEEARPKSARGLEKSPPDDDDEQPSPPADQGESGPSFKDERETEGGQGQGGASSISSPVAEIPDISDMSTAEYHYVLISAISTVTNDLKAKPAKKYTFAEWAFYLTLVGEDESSADTHRAASPLGRRHPPHAAVNGRGMPADPEPDHPVDGSKRPLRRGRRRRRRSVVGRPGLGRTRTYLEYFENEKQEEEREGRNKWSWVGDYSPLMGGVAEAEWILERLTIRLKEELQGAWKEEEGSESGGSGAGDGDEGSSGKGSRGGDPEKEE